MHPPPPPTPPSHIINEDRRLLLAAMNRIRKSAGAPPLCSSQELTAIACRWIANLATAGIQSCDDGGTGGSRGQEEGGGEGGDGGGGIANWLSAVVREFQRVAVKGEVAVIHAAGIDS